MTTLIICPHRDDEAISCGGLILKRLAQGDKVHVLSVFGRVYDYGRETVLQTHLNEKLDMEKAKEILGYQHLHLHNFIEGEPQSHGYYSLLEVIEKLIFQHHFNEVVVPGANDLNQDHRHLHHVCQIALRASSLQNIARVLEFIALDGLVKEPNYFVPMTMGMLRLKIESVNAYRREKRTGNSPRSPKNIDAQARVWGTMINRELAEGFILRKEIA